MRKPSPGSPRTFSDRHAHAVVRHLAVRRPAAATMSHHRHRLDGDAGRIGGHEDLARAAMWLAVGIGDRHDDREARSLGARREPLVTVDDPFVPVENGPRTQQRGVRPRDVRLGHGEERPRVALDERTQKALLLLVRAEQVEDLAVAGIGRLAVEDELAPGAPSDLLVEVRVGEKALAGAAGFRRQVRRPEPLRLRARAQRRHQRLGGIVLTVQGRFGRIDMLLEKRAIRRAQVFELLERRELSDRHEPIIAS